jgi:hypothetical protein
MAGLIFSYGDQCEGQDRYRIGAIEDMVQCRGLPPRLSVREPKWLVCIRRTTWQSELMSSPLLL